MRHPKQPYFWIALALVLYLFFSLTYLTLPGLHYDETNFANAAMGKENAPFRIWEIEVLGKKLPLMIMSYIGSVKSALYAPIFRIFGTGATAVRLPVVILGLFTLLISFAVFRRMFDRRIALAALLLFATDPTFIFANRLDWGPVSLMLLLEMASLYFMWRWMKEGKRSFLGIAGFCLGLGLYNKIIFAWFTAALLLSLLLFFREELKKLLRPRLLMCFLPAFLLGCLPLIAYNIAIPMGTFKDRPGFSSFEMETLRQRYYLFRGTLDGGGVYNFVNQEDISDPDGIPNKEASGTTDPAIRKIAGISWIRKSPLDLVLVGSLLLISIFLISKRLRDPRPILFVGSILLIIAALICLTGEATGAHHVISLYPFIFIVIAFTACELGNWLTRSHALASGILAGVLLLPLCLIHIVLDTRHLQSFKRTGGVGVWSDAVYDLASFARQNPDRKFMLMQWGLGNQFPLLSDERTRYQEFACDGPDLLESCIEPLIAQTDALLVFYAPPLGDKLLFDAFKKSVERNHLQARLRKTFFQRDGRPVYLVYQTLHAAQEAYTKQTHHRREAEDFGGKAGGGIDFKAGASCGAALGNFWGRHPPNNLGRRIPIQQSARRQQAAAYYSAFGMGAI
jgi:4-amino-4-deoxy-L-arabinose transferase-like glycosyltransferase